MSQILQNAENERPPLLSTAQAEEVNEIQASLPGAIPVHDDSHMLDPDPNAITPSAKGKENANELNEAFDDFGEGSAHSIAPDKTFVNFGHEEGDVWKDNDILDPDEDDEESVSTESSSSVQEDYSRRLHRSPYLDPDFPRRPLTPFFSYMHTARPIIAADLGPTAAKGAVSTEGARRWNVMPPKRKSTWTEAYKENLRLYDARVIAYKDDIAAKKLARERAIPDVNAAYEKAMAANNTADMDFSPDLKVNLQSYDKKSWEERLTFRSAIQEVRAAYVKAMPANNTADSATEESERDGSTTSVRSSVRSSVDADVHQFGRTYHTDKPGTYFMPDDDKEQERLFLQHHLFCLTFGDKLHLAPIGDNPQRVLDFATGNGIWAAYFSKQYPSAQVLGSALSPIQADNIPPNCQFEVSDADEKWNYSQPFDYIHGGTILSGFKDPKSVISHAFHALKPGGYLEIQDIFMPLCGFDDSFSGTHLQGWSRAMWLAGAAALGRPCARSGDYKRYMAEVGFVEVVEQHFAWPKLLGAWCLEVLQTGLYGRSAKLLTRGLGWSEQLVGHVVADVRNDLRDRTIHAYIDVVVVYGRKPL